MNGTLSWEATLHFLSSIPSQEAASLKEKNLHHQKKFFPFRVTVGFFWKGNVIQ